ncbi:MAG: leucine-rich repeat protein [Bacteroidaceae bacterium]|nr:leucine-rich repeat protein [Bacteroidaceae bacterium]
MRRFLLLLLFVPCALLHAYDVEVDGVYYNIVGTSMAHVTHKGFYNNVEYNSYTGDIVIPEQISYKGKTYQVYMVGNSAFAGCEGLTSVLLPPTVHGVGSCAFIGCDNLRQVSFTTDIRRYGSCAFTGCTSLQEITLPRRAELIDTLTLYCCASLKSMVLYHRIRTVCHGALEHLPAMRHLYCYASEPPVAEKGAFALQDQQRCTLHVPRETLEKYMESPGWKDFYRIVALSDSDYAAQNYQKGDVNDDGKVDAEDLALLRRIVVSLPDNAAVRWAADINGDGKVNSVDYVMLASKL